MADFLSEVREQPAALQRLLAGYARPAALQGARSLGHGRRAVVFAGMGASLFASQPAAVYLAGRGVPAQASDAGELLHYGWPALRRSTLVVAVSQSGESYEIVALVERLRGRAVRPPIVAVTNAPESALGQMADLTLPLYAGPEEATTSKTYVNSLALLLLLATALAGDSLAAARQRLLPLPEMLASLIQNGTSLGRRLADFLAVESYLPVIGRGPSLASALHGALVLKEAAGLGAEGFSGGAFRHGPFEMVGPELSAIVFAGGRTGELNQRLAREMVRRGARVALLAPERLPVAPLLLPVALPAAPEHELPVLEIVPLQFLAITLGCQRGREPGALRVSGKVVQREW